jgi:DNA-binding Xre family transcriptional regulator
VNPAQDTDRARPAAPSTRPLPPFTFVLDGHLLRQLRHQRGLSQAGLADQAGISLATVSRLERQPHAPCRGWTLGRLARAIGENPATMTLPRPSDELQRTHRLLPPSADCYAFSWGP